MCPVVALRLAVFYLNIASFHQPALARHWIHLAHCDRQALTRALCCPSHYAVTAAPLYHLFQEAGMERAHTMDTTVIDRPISLLSRLEGMSGGEGEVGSFPPCPFM